MPKWSHCDENIPVCGKAERVNVKTDPIIRLRGLSIKRIVPAVQMFG